MTAALNYLSRITEAFFESQMRRAARKINCTAAAVSASLRLTA